MAFILTDYLYFGVGINFKSSFDFTFSHVIMKLLVFFQKIFAFLKSIYIKLFLPCRQSKLLSLLFTGVRFGRTSHDTICFLFVGDDFHTSVNISVLFVRFVWRTVS